jgi:4-hydroxy-3-methylbut-2-enyl diphosphate reductase
VSDRAIKHRPVGVPSTHHVTEVTTSGWLPSGPLTVGLTAGASTPNSIVGEIIERLEVLTGPAASGRNPDAGT